MCSVVSSSATRHTASSACIPLRLGSCLPIDLVHPCNRLWQQFLEETQHSLPLRLAGAGYIQYSTSLILTDPITQAVAAVPGGDAAVAAAGARGAGGHRVRGGVRAAGRSRRTLGAAAPGWAPAAAGWAAAARRRRRAQGGARQCGGAAAAVMQPQDQCPRPRPPLQGGQQPGGGGGSGLEAEPGTAGGARAAVTRQRLMLLPICGVVLLSSRRRRSGRGRCRYGGATAAEVCLAVGSGKAEAPGSAASSGPKLH